MSTSHLQILFHTLDNITPPGQQIKGGVAPFRWMNLELLLALSITTPLGCQLLLEKAVYYPGSKRLGIKPSDEILHH